MLYKITASMFIKYLSNFVFLFLYTAQDLNSK